MKCGSDRRTRSSTNGPKRARVHANQRISVTRTLICSAPSARAATPAPRSSDRRGGQKTSLVYQGAKTGTRPRKPKDQRYENAYLFAAVCPSRDTGAAVI